LEQGTLSQKGEARKEKMCGQSLCNERVENCRPFRLTGEGCHGSAFEPNNEKIYWSRGKKYAVENTEKRTSDSHRRGWNSSGETHITKKEGSS